MTRPWLHTTTAAPFRAASGDIDGLEVLDTRRGGSIDPRSGSHARTRVTNLPESTGKLWHPFLSACFYALLALEEPFSRERLWKVLSIDFDAFLPRHPLNDLKWNSEAVCIFFLS